MARRGKQNVFEALGFPKHEAAVMLLRAQLAEEIRRWIEREGLTQLGAAEHFGISAPRVAIRTHLPWYWRALAIVLLSGASLALAAWIYDAGQRFAGFHQGVSEQEIAGMRERIAQLERDKRVLTEALRGTP